MFHVGHQEDVPRLFAILENILSGPAQEDDVVLGVKVFRDSFEDIQVRGFVDVTVAVFQEALLHPAKSPFPTLCARRHGPPCASSIHVVLRDRIALV